MKCLSKPIVMESYLYSFIDRLFKSTRSHSSTYTDLKNNVGGIARLQILTNLYTDISNEIFK